MELGPCEPFVPVLPADRRVGIISMDEDHWYLHRVLTGGAYVLEPVAADVDLFVYSADCSELLCASVLMETAAETCFVSGGGEYRVRARGYGATSYFISFQDPALPMLEQLPLHTQKQSQRASLTQTG